MRVSNKRMSQPLSPTEWGLDAFASEYQSVYGRAHRTFQWMRGRRLSTGATGIVLLLLAASALIAWHGAGVTNATLRLESEPSGAVVRLDGERRGVTPMMLTLAPGTYSVAIGTGEGAKTRRVSLSAAERASVYDVLGPVPGVQPAPASQLATLSVITDPVGGNVEIDGVRRGAAPIVVPNLSAGEHRIVVRNTGTAYRRTVVLQAGSHSTVVLGASPVSTAGRLTAHAPFPLRIYEAGRLLGTTQIDSLMLEAGEHQLEFSDERTGFRVIRTVRISPGVTETLRLPVPEAPLNVNAIPWGEVWVDEHRAGETPIGNYMLQIGEHEIEVRHPTLGAKRATVLVTLHNPNRFVVDMRAR
jgi:hypothetical protein